MSPSSTSSVSASKANPASRLSTLPEGEPPFTLGYEAAQWAHEWLVQPNGPMARKPFRLTFDQFRFLLWWYAIDERGAWVYSHGVRRLAKGSGKSPFAAVLALIEFCGPVRLDRFDDRKLGRCVGKPVDMPLVQIAATAQSQTANTMRMVRAFAPKGSKVVDEHHLDPGKYLYYKLPEGTLEIITSSATAAEGAESSFVIADETEHWKPSNGGPELAATLEDNLAKSGSRMLETSNAWKPGLDTVAESSWESWVAQEEGRLQDDAGRILYDARLAPPETDIADFESLKAALEHVYGDCTWKIDPATGKVDVLPIIKRIWSPRSRVDDVMRKYLNRPTVDEDAWTTPEEWAVLADTSREVSPTEPVVFFFDGSKSGDATALIGCCVDDGHIFTHEIWEPNLGRPGAVVPVDEVDAYVEAAFRSYNVVGFFGDVREWESFVKIDWPKRFGDRLVVDAVPGGKDPQRIAWDMRGHVLEFTRACELTLAEIEDGLFTHDDDPRLARHIANCRRRPNNHGVSVGKESPASPLKIDAAVCVIGARMVRNLVIASGALDSRKRTGRASFL